MPNPQNLKPVRTSEEAKKRGRNGGVASGKARKQRRTIAEVLRKVLDEPMAKGSKETRLDGISYKVIKNLYDNPSVKGLRILAEILGELEHKVTAEGLSVNITTSKEGKKNINQILKGE